MCIVNEKEQALLHALRALNVAFFILIHFFALSFVRKKNDVKRLSLKSCVSAQNPKILLPSLNLKYFFASLIFVLLFLSTTSNDLFCSCKVDVTN